MDTIGSLQEDVCWIDAVLMQPRPLTPKDGSHHMSGSLSKRNNGLIRWDQLWLSLWTAFQYVQVYCWQAREKRVSACPRCSMQSAYYSFFYAEFHPRHKPPCLLSHVGWEEHCCGPPNQIGLRSHASSFLWEWIDTIIVYRTEDGKTNDPLSCQRLIQSMLGSACPLRATGKDFRVA